MLAPHFVMAMWFTGFAFLFSVGTLLVISLGYIENGKESLVLEFGITC